MPQGGHSITDLLVAHRSGQTGAFERLVECLYGDLRELAQIQLRAHHPAQTLNTTALVNELYSKLADQDCHHWKDRNHFFAACAATMRNLLVDSARRRMRDKRGGGVIPLTLDEREVPAEGDPVWLVELDQLIDRLASHDARQARVFECRYFGGFSTAETAEILSMSERTVERDWARARAWLRQALEDAFAE